MREQKDLLPPAQLLRNEDILDNGVLLTRMESQLLLWLRRHPGKCLSRKFLLETIWGYKEGVRSRTLDVHIRRLRRKLGPLGHDCIKTVFRNGYSWCPSDHELLGGSSRFA